MKRFRVAINGVAHVSAALIIDAENADSAMVAAEMHAKSITVMAQCFETLGAHWDVNGVTDIHAATAEEMETK